MEQTNISLLKLFPRGTTFNNKGHLVIGQCDCIELVEQLGTPLYIFDENAIRYNCREFIREFKRLYENTEIIYASKAFINKAIAKILKEEGCGLDVVSGGEIFVASQVRFPGDKIYFHGNNKSTEELIQALSYPIGRIVVDNFIELETLNSIASSHGWRPKILLRLSPGIDAHTHQYTTTGILDSKFGFPITTGQAEEAIVKSLNMKGIELTGIHCHLGSPIYNCEPYKLAVQVMINFAREMKDKHGFELKEFSPGGGFAVAYTPDQNPPEIKEYAQTIIEALKEQLEINKLQPPKLIIEPGRAIIANTAIALYRIGSSKIIPNIRNYIFVDGGMGDNIRPALYQSKYVATMANRLMNASNGQIYTIAGRFCESGDILIKDIRLDKIQKNDILAIPVSGAYSIPMSSNYNLVPRPCIVLVNNGSFRVIRKRESYKDLTRLDKV